MERLWYYTQGSEQKGPIPESEFRARVQRGEIALHELAWTSGMPNWEPISSRPELRWRPSEAVAGESAAVSPTASASPAVRSEAVPSFGPWLTIVGVANILTGILLVLTCIGIPLAVLQIIAGTALFSARTLLNVAPTAPVEIAQALTRFRTYFFMTAIVFLIQAAVALAALLFNIGKLALLLKD